MDGAAKKCLSSKEAKEPTNHSNQQQQQQVSSLAASNGSKLRRDPIQSIADVLNEGARQQLKQKQQLQVLSGGSSSGSSKDIIAPPQPRLPVDKVEHTGGGCHSSSSSARGVSSGENNGTKNRSDSCSSGAESRCATGTVNTATDATLQQSAQVNQGNSYLYAYNDYIAQAAAAAAAAAASVKKQVAAVEAGELSADSRQRHHQHHCRLLFESDHSLQQQQHCLLHQRQQHQQSEVTGSNLHKYCLCAEHYHLHNDDDEDDDDVDDDLSGDDSPLDDDKDDSEDRSRRKLRRRRKRFELRQLNCRQELVDQQQQVTNQLSPLASTTTLYHTTAAAAHDHHQKQQHQQQLIASSSSNSNHLSRYLLFRGARGEQQQLDGGVDKNRKSKKDKQTKPSKHKTTGLLFPFIVPASSFSKQRELRKQQASSSGGGGGKRNKWLSRNSGSANLTSKVTAGATTNQQPTPNHLEQYLHIEESFNSFKQQQQQRRSNASRLAAVYNGISVSTNDLEQDLDDELPNEFSNNITSESNCDRDADEIQFASLAAAGCAAHRLQQSSSISTNLSCDLLDDANALPAFTCLATTTKGVAAEQAAALFRQGHLVEHHQMYTQQQQAHNQQHQQQHHLAGHLAHLAGQAGAYYVTSNEAAAAQAAAGYTVGAGAGGAVGSAAANQLHHHQQYHPISSDSSLGSNSGSLFASSAQRLNEMFRSFWSKKCLFITCLLLILFIFILVISLSAYLNFLISTTNKAHTNMLPLSGRLRIEPQGDSYTSELKNRTSNQFLLKQQQYETILRGALDRSASLSSALSASQQQQQQQQQQQPKVGLANHLVKLEVYAFKQATAPATAGTNSNSNANGNGNNNGLWVHFRLFVNKRTLALDTLLMKQRLGSDEHFERRFVPRLTQQTLYSGFERLIASFGSSSAAAPVAAASTSLAEPPAAANGQQVASPDTMAARTTATNGQQQVLRTSRQARNGNGNNNNNLQPRSQQTAPATGASSFDDQINRLMPVIESIDLNSIQVTPDFDMLQSASSSLPAHGDQNNKQQLQFERLLASDGGNGNLQRPSQAAPATTTTAATAVITGTAAPPTTTSTIASTGTAVMVSSGGGGAQVFTIQQRNRQQPQQSSSSPFLVDFRPPKPGSGGNQRQQSTSGASQSQPTAHTTTTSNTVREIANNISRNNNGTGDSGAFNNSSDNGNGSGNKANKVVHLVSGQPIVSQNPVLNNKPKLAADTSERLLKAAALAAAVAANKTTGPAGAGTGTVSTSPATVSQSSVVASSASPGKPQQQHSNGMQMVAPYLHHNQQNLNQNSRLVESTVTTAASLPSTTTSVQDLWKSVLGSTHSGKRNASTSASSISTPATTGNANQTSAPATATLSIGDDVSQAIRANFFNASLATAQPPVASTGTGAPSSTTTPTAATTTTSQRPPKVSPPLRHAGSLISTGTSSSRSQQQQQSSPASAVILNRDFHRQSEANEQSTATGTPTTTITPVTTTSATAASTTTAANRNEGQQQRVAVKPKQQKLKQNGPTNLNNGESAEASEAAAGNSNKRKPSIRNKAKKVSGQRSKPQVIANSTTAAAARQVDNSAEQLSNGNNNGNSIRKQSAETTTGAAINNSHLLPTTIELTRSSTASTPAMDNNSRRGGSESTSAPHQRHQSVLSAPVGGELSPGPMILPAAAGAAAGRHPSSASVSMDDQAARLAETPVVAPPANRPGTTSFSGQWRPLSVDTWHTASTEHQTGAAGSGSINNNQQRKPASVSLIISTERLPPLNVPSIQATGSQSPFAMSMDTTAGSGGSTTTLTTNLNVNANSNGLNRARVIQRQDQSRNAQLGSNTYQSLSNSNSHGGNGNSASSGNNNNNNFESHRVSRMRATTGGSRQLISSTNSGSSSAGNVLIEAPISSTTVDPAVSTGNTRIVDDFMITTDRSDANTRSTTLLPPLVLSSLHNSNQQQTRNYDDNERHRLPLLPATSRRTRGPFAFETLRSIDTASVAAADDGGATQLPPPSTMTARAERATATGEAVAAAAASHTGEGGVGEAAKRLRQDGRSFAAAIAATTDSSSLSLSLASSSSVDPSDNKLLVRKQLFVDSGSLESVSSGAANDPHRSVSGRSIDYDDDDDDMMKGAPTSTHPSVTTANSLYLPGSPVSQVHRDRDSDGNSDNNNRDSDDNNGNAGALLLLPSTTTTTTTQQPLTDTIDRRQIQSANGRNKQFNAANISGDDDDDGQDVANGDHNAATARLMMMMDRFGNRKRKRTDNNNGNSLAAQYSNDAAIAGGNNSSASFAANSSYGDSQTDDNDRLADSAIDSMNQQQRRLRAKSAASITNGNKKQQCKYYGCKSKSPGHRYVCLNETQICDDFIDCQDESDELDCVSLMKPDQLAAQRRFSFSNGAGIVHLNRRGALAPLCIDYYYDSDNHIVNRRHLLSPNSTAGEQVIVAGSRLTNINNAQQDDAYKRQQELIRQINTIGHYACSLQSFKRLVSVKINHHDLVDGANVIKSAPVYHRLSIVGGGADQVTNVNTNRAFSSNHQGSYKSGSSNYEVEISTTSECPSQRTVFVKCGRFDCGQESFSVIEHNNLAKRNKRKREAGVVLNDFPWLVKLSWLGKQTCTGYLIDELWLIASSECFVNKTLSPSDWVAEFSYEHYGAASETATTTTTLDSTDPDSATTIEPSNKRSVRNIFMPFASQQQQQSTASTNLPSDGSVSLDTTTADSSQQHDSSIVLLKLNKPVRFSPMSRPICLPLNTTTQQVNNKASMSSWSSPARNSNQPDLDNTYKNCLVVGGGGDEPSVAADLISSDAGVRRSTDTSSSLLKRSATTTTPTLTPTRVKISRAENCFSSRNSNKDQQQQMFVVGEDKDQSPLSSLQQQQRFNSLICATELVSNGLAAQRRSGSRHTGNATATDGSQRITTNDDDSNNDDAVEDATSSQPAATTKPNDRVLICSVSQQANTRLRSRWTVVGIQSKLVTSGLIQQQQTRAGRNKWLFSSVSNQIDWILDTMNPKSDQQQQNPYELGNASIEADAVASDRPGNNNDDKNSNSTESRSPRAAVSSRMTDNNAFIPIGDGNTAVCNKFKCSTGECLSWSRICDGLYDCSSHEDEKDCHK